MEDRDTRDARLKRKAAAADVAATTVRDALVRLCTELGLPPDAVLAGAHAEIVSAMTAAFGGDFAAESCRNAAARVAGMPSAADAALAAVQPAGHA